MQDKNDMELVREYAAHNSEAAFEALVNRHIHLVYSAALRQVGNPHLAEEITQAAFVILARKAKSLHHKTILAGWLFRTVRFAAADELKSAIRRQRREQEAYMETITSHEPVESPEWKQISPLLDEAIAHLGEKDRNAVILRFFEQKPLQEVGMALGVNADAAQKRITRALDKLRFYFLKRNVSSTGEAIAGAIASHSIQLAPELLAQAVTAAALTHGATASVSTITLVKGALKIMAWTKAKTAIVVSTVAIATLLGTTPLVVKLLYFARIKDAYFQSNYRQFQQLPAGLFVLRQTHFGRSSSTVDFSAETSSPSGQHATWTMGRNRSFQALLGHAYNVPQYLIVFPAVVPKEHFDYLSTVLDDRVGNRLQTAIKKQLGYVAGWHEQPAAVYLLTVQTPFSPALKPAAAGDRTFVRQTAQDQFKFQNVPLRNLAFEIQNRANVPVVDATGLTNAFNFTFDCAPADLAGRNFDSINQSLADLGLQLVLTNMPMNMLVVEKAD